MGPESGTSHVRSAPGEVWGTSACAAIAVLVDRARSVASTGGSLLLEGEPGTGKLELARAVHAWSGRCGPAVLLWPNHADPTERVRYATHGTLIVPEIPHLGSNQQAALLRALAESPQLAVVATSQEDLLEAVDAGAFRADLYAHVANIVLHVPALRTRREDILRIAHRWLAHRAATRGSGPWTLSEPAQQAMLAHRWEGNVQQLLNALERATLVQRSGELGLRALALPGTAPAPEPSPRLPTFQEQEHAYLSELMRRAKGKVYGPTGAAVRAGLKPTTLHSKLKKHGLK